ncbi:hypothetical protein ACGFZQ_32950 [Streptomyces sp. NPDC048254]|uniref:hypothetical protein n=1 Tax=Streptomyces sp. NPDC048254 TaxID=3365525 RepID=UPI003717E669
MPPRPAPSSAPAPSFNSSPTDGTWSTVVTAGTVGASRILRLAQPVRARRWRVRVTAARGEVRLAGFALFRSASV